jgi:hypothetical protein
MRPTSRKPSVDKVDVDLDAVTGGCGTHDRADALRGTTSATDHAAQITGADLDLELQAVLALDSVDFHSIGVVDDRTDDVSEHCRRRWGRNLIGALGRLDGLVDGRLIGHLAARAAVNSAIAPDTSKSFFTRSVG